MTARRTLLSCLFMLAFGLVLTAAGASAAENPVGKLVAEIIPLDLKTVDAEYVKGIMFTRPGKPYDDSTINEDVRRLLNTHLFVPGSVSVSTAIGADGRVTVFVRLRELTGVASEVLYFGAQHLSQSELQDLTQIRKGGPMNPSTNQLGKTAILNKLREDGRYYASVELTEGNTINDTRVVYQIVEGRLLSDECLLPQHFPPDICVAWCLEWERYLLPEPTATPRQVDWVLHLFQWRSP